MNFYKCEVIGNGTPVDRYRPSCFEELIGWSWAGVFYPENPPYAFCVIATNALLPYEQLANWEELKKFNITKEHFGHAD